ncbi:MAG: lipoate--protein ligase family protein [Planctomycetota bacterium]
MQWLHRTLGQPAAELALDEALLEAAIDGESGEVLRVWESTQTMVVLGRSSRVDDEVYQEACGERGVPVLRRVSGGLTIVTGPGCLMYAVVLNAMRRPELAQIDAAHRYVLDRVAAALRQAGAPAEHAGTSDLVLPPGDGAGPLRKCSGNSLRVRRKWLLYHGTLLYDFDLPLIATLLRQPPRAPEYRAGRGHDAFVANAAVDRQALIEALADAWQADEPFRASLDERVDALVRERYARSDWNLAR